MLMVLGVLTPSSNAKRKQKGIGSYSSKDFSFVYEVAACFQAYRSGWRGTTEGRTSRRAPGVNPGVRLMAQPLSIEITPGLTPGARRGRRPDKTSYPTPVMLFS